MFLAKKSLQALPLIDHTSAKYQVNYNSQIFNFVFLSRYLFGKSLRFHYKILLNLSKHIVVMAKNE